MDIASWNVNSIKARSHAVTQWLEEAKPDVVCIQEIKTVDEGFPAEIFENMGYNVAVHGQKSYHGVALLSKHPFEEVTKRLPDINGSICESDEQSRYIEAVISTPNGPVRFASIYLPNGNPTVDTDGELTEKYRYKLNWMERLYVQTKRLLAFEEPLILAGDYNIIPTDNDVHDAALWAGDALIRPQSRAAYRKLLNLGLTSAYEQCDGRDHQYTFWDYQAGARPKNNGIRIDHLLCSAQAIDAVKSVRIDDHVRDREKPSDHVPIIGTFDL